MFDNARKIRPNYSFHWKVCLFFQSFVFSTDSWMIKKWSCISHQDCRKSSWSLTKGYCMSVLVGNMRKIVKKNLFLRDDSLCFEKFGCRLLRSWTNDQIACTIPVKKPRVPWKIVPWCLSCSMIREKNNPLYFFRSKDYLFYKIFVFNNLLGVTEMIL